MGAIVDPSISLQIDTTKNISDVSNNNIVEEIEGIIRVYKDGHVERPQIVPCVAPSLVDGNLVDEAVSSQDIEIDNNIWVRFYVPTTLIVNNNKELLLPLIVYFHGGGFCVGSAAWNCYDEFLRKLVKKCECLIMSVNYRLAPENPLPAAYEDGFKAITWLKQQVILPSRDHNNNNNNNNNNNGQPSWWLKQCDFSRVFLAGDSAGANIAYNVSKKLGTSHQITSLKPLITFKGLILIQPFFGGEARTNSEKYTVQPPHSALNLAASDTYWRLALPWGAGRDHPWCNPIINVEEMKVRLPKQMVCISELDILKDINLEFCKAMCRTGNKVEKIVYKSVGHAFQVLSKSQISQTRTVEMMAHIKSFIDC
ncbi:hypothetical protein ACFE04_018609 [Oxalis oulophora]